MLASLARVSVPVQFEGDSFYIRQDLDSAVDVVFNGEKLVDERDGVLIMARIVWNVYVENLC